MKKTVFGICDNEKCLDFVLLSTLTIIMILCRCEYPLPKLGGSILSHYNSGKLRHLVLKTCWDMLKKYVQEVVILTKISGYQPKYHITLTCTIVHVVLLIIAKQGFFKDNISCLSTSVRKFMWCSLRSFPVDLLASCSTIVLIQDAFFLY